MKNKNKKKFTNYVKEGIREEEIILSPPTELFNKAKDIAQNTKSDEKFSFVLKYNANQKDFLLSMLQMVGAVVEDDDERGHFLSTVMNMTQLAFIKHLDCVERVKTDERFNSFISEEGEKPDSDAIRISESTKTAMTLAAEKNVQGEEAMVTSTGTANIECCGSSNTTLNTAQEINTERLVSGNIGCSGAEQWFKFTVPQSGTYTIYTTGSLDTVGTLYDCYGNQIVEVDDHEPCGKLNFRITQILNANRIYYIRVREANNNMGYYNIKVTRKCLVDYISINKTEMTFDHIGKVYELPVLPNTFTGVEGAEPLTDLVASTVPSNADEKKIYWYTFDTDVIRVDTGRHNDDRLYQTLTVVGDGVAKLYAYDWNEVGKKAECTVYVPKVSVISCSNNGWISSSKTMGENMAIAFNCEGNYIVKTPTTVSTFKTCWDEANECVVIHTHGGPDGLYDEGTNDTPIIISKSEMETLKVNNRIQFIMMTACRTAGGPTNDNVAYWLSKKINPNGIVIANTDTVQGADKEFWGVNNNATWVVYKNGELKESITDVVLTMQKAYDIYQLYK